MKVDLSKRHTDLYQLLIEGMGWGGVGRRGQDVSNVNTFHRLIIRALSVLRRIISKFPQTQRNHLSRSFQHRTLVGM